MDETCSKGKCSYEGCSQATRYLDFCHFPSCFVRWSCFSFFGHLLLPKRKEASGSLLAVRRGPLAKVKGLNSG